MTKLVGYRYVYGRRSVGCVVSDGRMTFAARTAVPREVGRRRLGKRIRKFLKSKVARKIAQAALRVAELYPGTAVALKALRLGKAAIDSAKKHRPLDVIERIEEMPELARQLGRGGREDDDDDDGEEED